MGKKIDYEALALTILPPNCDFGRSKLRTRIAQTFEKELQQALDRQREEAFPDLQATRERLDLQHRQLVQNQLEQDQKKKELDRREQDLLAKEKDLESLFKALDAYTAWLDGDGQIDENGKRFQALCNACKSYREKKK